ncbi:hypothetical protein HK099_003564, partial [Clydaea vesicula]
MIEDSNRRSLGLAMLPYRIGLFASITGAIMCVPMIFQFDCVMYFNHHFVTADIPEPKDLETWLENIGARPYTSWYKHRRSERLTKEFPQYDKFILKAFSEGDPLSVREEKYIDPFEKFWENVETLVNNGKGAVAFTTAAQILANNEQENCDISNDPANLQEQFGSYFIVPRTENFTDVNLKFSFSSPLNAENHLHRFKNPLVGGKSNKKSFEELELENELLKKTLNELTLRM